MENNLITPTHIVRIWEGTTIDLNNIAMISDAYLHPAGHGYMVEAYVGCDITTISGKSVIIKEGLNDWTYDDPDYSFDGNLSKWLTVDGIYEYYQDIKNKKDIRCIHNFSKKVQVLIDAWNKNKTEITDLFPEINQ